MNEINQAQILLPVLALVALTFFMILLVGYRRLKLGVKGEISPDDFAMGESERVPKYVLVVNRNYMNLLELPVLFYLASILLYTLNAVTVASLAIAWTYVGLRYLHSIVHITYNNVPHRLMLFGVSNIFLAIMWFLLLMPNILDMAG